MSEYYFDFYSSGLALLRLQSSSEFVTEAYLDKGQFSCNIVFPSIPPYIDFLYVLDVTSINMGIYI